jgi:hypothetical protein
MNGVAVVDIPSKPALVGFNKLFSLTALPNSLPFGWWSLRAAEDQNAHRKSAKAVLCKMDCGTLHLGQQSEQECNLLIRKQSQQDVEQGKSDH